MCVLISCEVCGTRCPEVQSAGARYMIEAEFAAAAIGIDHDAAWVADRFSELLQAPIVKNPYRRDFIDVTRSTNHRLLFGDVSRQWPDDWKQQLIDRVYLPYRTSVHEAIEGILENNPFVIHISVRTFAASQQGRMLRTDVGLLYDPSRFEEVELCLDWMDEMYESYPNLRMRRNYPQRGTSDTFTRTLRNTFPQDRYLGIEMWLNRAWAGRAIRLRDEAIQYLAKTFSETIGW